jgi:PKD repeat protein
MTRTSSPAKVALRTLVAATLAGLIWIGCTGDQTGPTAPDDQTAAFIQNLRPAIDVQTRHNDRLLAISGVVGTAVGLDEDGKPTIKLFTSEPGISGLPDDLEGVPVKVEVTGMFYALQGVDPTGRFPRPVPTGVSVGHPNVTAGSIGFRVKDGAGNVFILSNNHVLANQNNASIGDAALQPGAYDGGTDPADRIGTLYDFEPIEFARGRRVPKNAMDAAIAQTSTAMLGYSTPSGGYGTPGTTVVQPSVGLAVQKYGRTTGLTHGTVSEVNVTVDVCYEGYIFCTKSARFTKQFAVTPGTFSGGGDSGSGIVIDNANADVVGLLFAGSSDRTIATPIGPVLNRFDVTIDDGGGGDPPGNNPPSASFTSDCTYLSCEFDASTSYDSDGTITSFEWDLGDGNAASGVTTSRTYATDGTYTVTLTVTDDEGASSSSSQDVTVTSPGAPGTMHVGDLLAMSSTEGKTWSAIVAVLVHDADHNVVGLATVNGTWSASGPLPPVDQCTTEETPVDGDCLVFNTLIPKKVRSVNFTVDNLTNSGLTYSPDDNHDADGDSDGTPITVRKP